MAFETKEQVLDRIMAADKPHCPHCDQEMNLWEVPPVNVGDGLGWGVPYLYLCFNDECPVYMEGWENMRTNYGRSSSYRCMCYPGESNNYELMPVFSPIGATGQIIDDEVVAAEEALKINIKRGFSLLADCYVSRDVPTILQLLLDAAEPVRVRLKAAEMLGDIGVVDAIEPARCARFGNELLQKAVDEAIAKIHSRFFTRECPFCAEIVKQRAAICKHCNREIAGV